VHAAHFDSPVRKGVVKFVHAAVATIQLTSLTESEIMFYKHVGFWLRLS
jgi:hypothetical protein